MGAEPVHVWHMVFVLPSMQFDAGEPQHEEDSSAEVTTGGGDGGDGSAGGGGGGGGEGTAAT
tara:strand:+ start:520 stop:705 length:186 start_codon:yes stop_codon:yes gene_type:complete